MPPRTRDGSPALGAAIRTRRRSLNLSIDEAAAKAGVGAKTWGRYESGASLREDKVQLICKALGWQELPHDDHAPASDTRLEVETTHPAWSRALETALGTTCALTFAAGSDILVDQISDDLNSLGTSPTGTHVGQLSPSWICDDLPPQFLTRYEYEFLYELRACVLLLRGRFSAGHLQAHTVLEELALYLIFGHAELFNDLYTNFDADGGDWREWVADLLSDLDIEHQLFSRHVALTPDSSYHFDHWRTSQFFTPSHT